MRSELPTWLQQLVTASAGVTADELSRHLPPLGGGRESAVLMLFGEGPYGPDVLLIERSPHLASHAGQPAFPGGAIDPEDDGPAAAAVREGVEETGLDPSGVDVIGVLPALFIPRSGYVVHPVLAWWRDPSDVHAAAPAEVAAVARVPVADLVDPANRVMLRHPLGHVGPAFRVAGLLVWGFTGGVLDKLLELGGWELPWARDKVEDLPAELWQHIPGPSDEPARSA